MAFPSRLDLDYWIQAADDTVQCTLLTPGNVINNRPDPESAGVGDPAGERRTVCLLLALLSFMSRST